MKEDLKNLIEHHFPQIEELFSETELSKLPHIQAEDLKLYNFGIGTLIRLKMLRKNSTLYKCFIHNKIKNKDDMTLIILGEFLEYKKSLKLNSHMLQ